MYYLSVDGGGSKIQALLYDEEGRRLGSGFGCGVNPNFLPLQTIREHMSNCIDACLGSFREPVQTAYISFPGPHELFAELLRQRVPLARMRVLSEGRMGLLSGILEPDGYIALSGTGSCVNLAHGEISEYQGGWGGILGDEGSGYEIGNNALKAAIRARDGWAEETVLGEMILAHFEIDTLRKLIPIVYHQADYRARIAQVARLAAAAALQGDRVALGIYREAATVMATQTIAVLRRWQARAEVYRKLPLTVCGGSWKGHASMFAGFAETVLTELKPSQRLLYPAYEMVLGGVVALLHEQGRPSEIADLLEAEYADLRHPLPTGWEDYGKELFSWTACPLISDI